MTLVIQKKKAAQLKKTNVLRKSGDSNNGLVSVQPLPLGFRAACLTMDQEIARRNTVSGRIPSQIWYVTLTTMETLERFQVPFFQPKCFGANTISKSVDSTWTTNSIRHRKSIVSCLFWQDRMCLDSATHVMAVVYQASEFSPLESNKWVIPL